MDAASDDAALPPFPGFRDVAGRRRRVPAPRRRPPRTGMTVDDPGGTWPPIPPEVPPPRHPPQPEPQPDRPWPVPMVPLVPSTGPGRGRGDRDLLLEHRTVLVVGPLDDATAARVAAEVMTLDAEGTGEIRLHLTCQDGELAAALMLAETIELLAAPVVATAKGVVGGVALAPFSAAGRRLASPRASFRLSEPQLSLSGAAHDITVGAEELLRQVGALHAWVASATGRPVDAVADDMQHGRLLDARGAVDYGLVDEVATTQRSS